MSTRCGSGDLTFLVLEVRRPSDTLARAASFELRYRPHAGDDLEALPVPEGLVLCPERLASDPACEVPE